jgi:TPP-dependent pyruvate/acetoin dehydrogenase alpha subunit
MMNNSKKQSPAPAAQNGFSLISDEKLLAIYATMLKCRLLEERMRFLFKLNPLNGNTVAGQEATVAGVVIDLLPEDNVRAVPSDILHLFVKGLPVEKLLAQPLSAGEPDANASEQLKLAIDDAIACKANKNNGIGVVFSSGESMDHNSWEASLKVAGANKLPILFVSQGTNGRAGGDVKSNGGRTRVKAKTYGFPAIAVEGNDAVAVYRVACEAIAHARMGDGPTLIECQRWQEGDPLANMENYLTRKGLFREEFKRQVGVRFLEELDAAEQVAEKNR